MKNLIIFLILTLSPHAFCSSKNINPTYTKNQIEPRFKELSICRHQKEILNIMNSVLTPNSKIKDDTLDEILFGLSTVGDFHGEQALNMIALKDVKLSPEELQQLVHKLARESIDWRKTIKDFPNQKQLNSSDCDFLPSENLSKSQPRSTQERPPNKKDHSLEEEINTTDGHTPLPLNLDSGPQSNPPH